MQDKGNTPTLGIGPELFLDNNYFTPSIEDIRVGYECEWWRDLTIEGDFIPVMLTRKQVGMYNTNMEGKIPSLRVPYLTKEQIEKEGWVGDATMTKGKYGLNLSTGIKRVIKRTGKDIESIKDVDERTSEPSLRIFTPSIRYSGTYDRELFIGNCKDINTFRYICKLLNIK